MEIASLSIHESPFREIPDSVWQRWIDENGFKTLFHLRKVCKPLREFFDNDFQPDVKLEWLKMSMITNGVFIRFGTDAREAHRWEYNPKKQGRILIVDGNMDGWRDLADVLKFQKSILKQLILTANFEENLKNNAEVLECFKNILSTLNTPLRTEHLHMAVMDQSKLLQILPFIEPSSLESIDILHPKISQSALRIDEIEQLPHFKAAKEFRIVSHNRTSRPHQLVNIPEFVLTVESISANELIYVIDKVIKIPTFVYFVINYHQFNDMVRLKELWGYSENFTERNYFPRETKDWYFHGSAPNSLINTRLSLTDSYIRVRILTGEMAELKANRAKNWRDWIGLEDEDTRRGIEAELGIVEE